MANSGMKLALLSLAACFWLIQIATAQQSDKMDEEIIDEEYPGTAVVRMNNIRQRARSGYVTAPRFAFNVFTTNRNQNKQLI